MKRLLTSIGIGMLALSLTTAFGEDENHPGRNKSAGSSGGARVSGKGATVRSSNHVSSRAATVRTNHAPKQTFSRSTSHVNRVSTRGNTTLRTNRNVTLNKGTNVSNRSRVNTNRERNVTRNNVVTNRNNTLVNRQRNVAINNNWRGSRFSGQNYAAFRNYHRQWHDRGWWRSHYNRIVFVGGGWYFWNAGYWFPAWGYDPGAYYPYDGPIYGYNGLAPNQVIVDVQSQLQRDGYYNGPIDGELGPITRQAITAFQEDHGLAVTSAIDEPTLQTLGIS